MYVTTRDNKYHKKFIPIVLSQTFQDIGSLLRSNWVFQYEVYPTRGVLQLFQVYWAPIKTALNSSNVLMIYL